MKLHVTLEKRLSLLRSRIHITELSIESNKQRWREMKELELQMATELAERNFQAATKELRRCRKTIITDYPDEDATS